MQPGLSHRARRITVDVKLSNLRNVPVIRQLQKEEKLPTTKLRIKCHISNYNPYQLITVVYIIENATASLPPKST